MHELPPPSAEPEKPPISRYIYGYSLGKFPNRKTITFYKATEEKLTNLLAPRENWSGAMDLPSIATPHGIIVFTDSAARTQYLETHAATLHNYEESDLKVAVKKGCVQSMTVSPELLEYAQILTKHTPATGVVVSAAGSGEAFHVQSLAEWARIMKLLAQVLIYRPTDPDEHARALQASMDDTLRTIDWVANGYPFRAVKRNNQNPIALPPSSLASLPEVDQVA
ncbi:hypothetical protein FWH58_02620 [Candidatus Saccharibacteria bacterium]|nr:hypothetical protein [Candidatus Saccharibacteria bacterium]